MSGDRELYDSLHCALGVVPRCAASSTFPLVTVERSVQRDPTRAFADPVPWLQLDELDAFDVSGAEAGVALRCFEHGAARASVTRVASACFEHTLSGEPAHALACRADRLPRAASANADVYLYFPSPQTAAGRYQCALPASADAGRPHPPLWLEFNIRVVRTFRATSLYTCLDLRTS